MSNMLQWITLVFLLIIFWSVYEIKIKFFKDVNSPDITNEVLGNPTFKFKEKEWKEENLEEEGYKIFSMKRDVTFGDLTLKKTDVLVVDKTPEPGKNNIVLLIVGGNEKKGDRVLLYQIKTKHKDGTFTVIRDNDKRKITADKIIGEIVHTQKQE